MIVTQTVDIPASHRLTIDIPREVPEGRTIITFAPAGAQALEIIRRKNIPNVTLPADESGGARIDKELHPDLYDWAVNG